MKTLPIRFFVASVLAVVGFVFTLHAGPAEGRLVAGSKLDTLVAGKATYQNVVVRSISARSAMITHTNGMASVLLRDLSPELQQRFGYDPEADRAQDIAAKAAQTVALQRQQARLETLRKSRAAAKSSSQSLGKVDQLLRSFGQKPELAEEVDLRPRFNELGLWVKNQGHRPSCAVFAMVSALEFQSAEANNNAERFSEEYLYWATCRTLNRNGVLPEAVLSEDASDEEDYSDAGFTLGEVATALRTYGVPLRDKVPNRLFGKTIETPPEELVQEARGGQRISVHDIPGHDGATLAANLIHALNLGIPVPIGIRWPDTRVWRVHHLDAQRVTMNYRHAVTVVGYQCKTGRIEDTVFIFKNSWGPRWGLGGYGTASYDYFEKYLGAAVVLEVQPSSRTL